jgi:hypothetical protein
VKKPLYYRMVEYDTALLPNRYLATLDRGSTTPEEWKRRTGYSIGYPAWGLLYYVVLCRLDPSDFNLVIETGSNLGCSSIIIGQAIRDSKANGVLHTVEIDESNFSQARENILQAGLQDEVRLHLGDSLVVFDNSYRIASADENQRVNGALRYILRTHGGNLVNFPFCSWYTPGMAIWQKQPFEEMTLPAV